MKHLGRTYVFVQKRDNPTSKKFTYELTVQLDARVLVAKNAVIRLAQLNFPSSNRTRPRVHDSGSFEMKCGYPSAELKVWEARIVQFVQRLPVRVLQRPILLSPPDLSQVIFKSFTSRREPQRNLLNTSLAALSAFVLCMSVGLAILQHLPGFGRSLLFPDPPENFQPSAARQKIWERKNTFRPESNGAQSVHTGNTGIAWAFLLHRLRGSAVPVPSRRITDSGSLHRILFEIRSGLSLATEVERVGELRQHSKWGQSTTVSGQQIIFGGWYVNGRNTAGWIRIAKNGGGYEYGGTAELMAVMAGFDRCDGQRAGSGMNGGIDPGQQIYDRARRPM
ncbi:hypothetical protein FB45DRAFT_1007499 [Roridomyces roridus]|uniref:Uncharacterized protein n=1 Tax=Roridomyces roridus TaxID=1738132 RepID=A0AAD7FFR4_9AGAR|nr:hypothetical protein FB45DRAFT_1007499 [Roridomyces roridus]